MKYKVETELEGRPQDGIGGIVGGVGNSLAQDVARLVAPLRARGLSWKKIFDAVPNHYANYRSMAGVMTGYGPCRKILESFAGNP